MLLRCPLNEKSTRIFFCGHYILVFVLKFSSITFSEKIRTHGAPDQRDFSTPHKSKKHYADYAKVLKRKRKSEQIHARISSHTYIQAM